MNALHTLLFIVSTLINLKKNYECGSSYRTGKRKYGRNRNGKSSFIGLMNTHSRRWCQENTRASRNSSGIKVKTLCVKCNDSNSVFPLPQDERNKAVCLKREKRVMLCWICRLNGRAS
jgi:hypothetical protein